MNKYEDVFNLIERLRGHHIALTSDKDEAADALEQLLKDKAALEQRVLDDNRSYGCELQDPAGTIWEYADKLRQEKEELEEVLRRLASYLGVGGYNADKVDPEVFENKIRDGISAITARSLIDALPEEDRLKLFREYCSGCGGYNPCYCWKDE